MTNNIWTRILILLLSSRISKAVPLLKYCTWSKQEVPNEWTTKSKYGTRPMCVDPMSRRVVVVQYIAHGGSPYSELTHLPPLMCGWFLQAWRRAQHLLGSSQVIANDGVIKWQPFITQLPSPHRKSAIRITPLILWQRAGEVRKKPSR